MSLQKLVVVPGPGWEELGPGIWGIRGSSTVWHAQVPPESFCELWIRDTKYVQQPCVALTVYVAMCHKFHVCIEWRRSDYCRESGPEREWGGQATPPWLLMLPSC